MTNGELIRKLRKEKGKTSKEFASLTGLSQAFVSLVENDKRNISANSLKKLADYFGVTADYLLSGGENKGIPITLFLRTSIQDYNGQHIRYTYETYSMCLPKRLRGYEIIGSSETDKDIHDLQGGNK
jgi:transcriptional regulator with XRE-family HTH domain